MRYTAIKADELTPSLRDRWIAIQQSSRRFASPYFRPEFTEAVAAVRDDVHIGLLEDDEHIIGFFPFHRRRGGIGRPIGLALSDYHGVVAAHDDWSVDDLLRGCGLIRFQFDHLLSDQASVFQAHDVLHDSPVIDIAAGFEHYERTRDKAGRKLLREVARKRAKLDEVAPIRLILHSDDAGALRTLREWKSAQCRRTGTMDYFSLNWCVGLVDRIHQSRTADFGGVFCCLYSGDELVAAHLAMRSRHVWHSWFPSYRREAAQYSPGLVLLVEMLRAAARDGIEYIDLGKGTSMYKKHLMTGAIPVAEGVVETPALLNRLLGLRHTLEAWTRNSALRPVLRLPGQAVKRLERRGRYG